MKRPLQLALAITLALGAADASALGLGTIQINSRLNQPLNAEIPIIQSSPGEAEGLIVQLASAEDFERVGLNRSRVGIPLEFALAKNARGESVIRITSTEIVREPFLDFLVEANWPNGRVLREYTVLLDPPIMAPAKGVPSASAVAQAPAPARTETLPPAKPRAPATPAPVAAAPKPAAAPSAPARAAAGDEFGPVGAGQTLSEIARATRADESISVDQMMLALLKRNPDAFYKNNINALKRGAILRIPSAEETRATASMRDAAEQARAQIQEWRGGQSPVVVADTGSIAAPVSESPSRSSAKSPASSGERVALVPPRAYADGADGADRPGAGEGAGTASSELRAELARTKEALGSSKHEAGELKSRLDALEETNSKAERMISLQNSQLAELQRKLDELNKNSTTATAAAIKGKSEAPVVIAVPAKAAEPDDVAKPDIWGGAELAAATAAAPAETTTPTTSSTDVADASVAAADHDPALATADREATGDTVPVVAATTEPDQATATSDASPSGTSAESAAAVAAPGEPAVSTTPTKPEVKTTVQPLPVAEPWYMQPWSWIGGAVVALLLLLGLSRRGKGSKETGRKSIADSFSDSPLSGSGQPHAVSHAAEEEALIEQIRNDPADAGLRLELLSLYYADGQVELFEATAQDMRDHVESHEAEWLQAVAMGRELAPHNPLFDGGDENSDLVDADEHYEDGATGFSAFDRVDDLAFGDESLDPLHEDTPSLIPDSAHDALDEPFEFDLAGPTVLPAESALPVQLEPSVHDQGFSMHPARFEEEELSPAVAVAESDEAMLAPIDEDFLDVGDDAISTKLDLAKAYLDMGDPDGARSMLEEVLAEGSEPQKSEARRLISEIS